MSERPEFCSKCGQKLSEDATFCPKCGAAVSAPLSPIVGRRAEKAEKREKSEKSEKSEKREKSEKHEKRGDMLGAVTGGLILVWLGVSFILARYLTAIRDWWPLFFVGVGLILIVQGVVRIGASQRKGSGWGSFIGGGVILVIGLAAMFRETQFWVYILLIAIGLAVIAGAWRARRESPRP